MLVVSFSESLLKLCPTWPIHAWQAWRCSLNTPQLKALRGCAIRCVPTRWPVSSHAAGLHAAYGALQPGKALNQRSHPCRLAGALAAGIPAPGGALQPGSSGHPGETASGPAREQQDSGAAHRPEVCSAAPAGGANCSPQRAEDAPLQAAGSGAGVHRRGGELTVQARVAGPLVRPRMGLHHNCLLGTQPRCTWR